MRVKRSEMLIWIFLASLAWVSTVVSQDPNDCSFDGLGGVTSCGLLMDTKAFAVEHWRLGTGEGTYFIGGPATDNSGSKTGGYAFTSTNDMFHTQMHHKKSWILTAVANTTGGTGRCLSFAYAMDGLSVASFKVLLVSYTVQNPEDIIENGTGLLEFQNTVLWTQKEITRGKWRKAQVSFTTLGDYSLAFAAEPNRQYVYSRGYVAIDDLKFSDGPCDNECMFDYDTCTWTNSDLSDFTFDLSRSSTKRGTGPSRDQGSSYHKEISTGGYAFIDSGYPRRTGDKARLVSALLNATATPLCIKFWLNMHGGGIGDVTLLYAPDSNLNITTELWKIRKDDSTVNIGIDAWTPCQQTVSSPEPFRLIFEASVGFPGAGDIGLDSITFSEESCPSIPTGSNSGWGDCNFLDGLCGWTIPSVDGTSCQMLERVAENSYNPPGHTWNHHIVADMYMKFDLGCYRNQAREKAAITSKSFSLKTPQCLSFWVYMYTTVATQTKFGALSVVLHSGDKNTTIWRLQNQQQAGWTYSQVAIPSGSMMSVSIEGTKGPNVIGMIAVDDLAVFDSNCQVEPAQARVEKADCTFDDGPCLYTIVSPGSSETTSHAWKFAKDETINVIKDHTFQADHGGFMFIDSLNFDITSQLRSPVLASNTTYCFTFHFASFYSDNTAKLSVYKENTPTTEHLWQATQALLPPRPTTNQHVNWHYAQVELDEQPSDYRIYIEAKVRAGGWAVDDIKFFKNLSECKTRPPGAAPAP